MAADKFAISRWTAEERLDELLAVVQAAFAGLAPPSSVMNETVTDLTRRLRDGLVLVARADDRFIGSVFAARQGDALYLTRLAVAPAWRRLGAGAASAAR